MEPDASTCDACHLPLRVRKTQSKTVHFPAVSVRLREVQRVCPRCGRVWRSPDYDRWTPTRSNLSWSLLVRIGHERYHRHRQVGEVVQDLSHRVSPSTVVRACDEYLARFVALHADADLWTKLLPRPVVWEVDGTTEEGGGSVFVVRAGAYTVHADGIPSEAEPHVAIVLEEARRRTGPPVAVGRDGADGIHTALAHINPEAVQIGCHYHVLRNAGERALGNAHVDLARALSTDHVRARLGAVARSAGPEWADRLRTAAAWILESRRGMAFPFRRPALDLVERMDQAWTWTRRLLAAGAKANRSLPDVTAFKTVLERYRLDPASPRPLAQRVRRAAGVLQRVAPWFDAIRDALDAFRETAQDPETDGARARAAVGDVERRALALGGAEGDLGLRLVQDVLDAWDELVPGVRHEGVLVRVERTISLTEQSHRAWKRGVRRRTGQSRVAPALRHHGPALALVSNWDQSAFRDAMGGLTGLVRRAASVDPVQVESAREILTRLRPAAGRRAWRKQGDEALRMLEEVAAAPDRTTGASLSAVEAVNG